MAYDRLSNVAFVTYEDRLDQDPRWALSEGSRHFDEKSAVFDALRKITQRLNDIGIPYAVVGGMALFRHGLRRFTEDVDILVTKEDLKKIHAMLDGLGYLPPHQHSKNLRDTDLGVRIGFLTTGDFPGNGKKKPVVFPHPTAVSTEQDGIQYINLPALIELKLASGMSNSNRLKDLADVQELIKILNLPAEYAGRLNPYVGDKYKELWSQGKKRYVARWPNKWLTSESKARDLESMLKDGVILENDGGAADEQVYLVTTDPEVAKKYDMVEESEFWGREEEKGAESETGSDDAPNNGGKPDGGSAD
jgi:Uncharacterised nucleotidyltransferase